MDESTLIPTEFVLFKAVAPDDLRVAPYLFFFKMLKTCTLSSTSLTN